MEIIDWIVPSVSYKHGSDIEVDAEKFRTMTYVHYIKTSTFPGGNEQDFSKN